MKIVLVLVGITFLVLAVLLTIIGLIAWIASRPKKQAAAPYPQQGYPPPPPPQPYVAPPPAAVPPQPYSTMEPPPPGFSHAEPEPPTYIPMPTPPAQPMPPPPPQPMQFEPAASEEKTVLVPTANLAAALGALACSSGPLAGRTFPIDPNGFYIGRDRNASQVVVEDTRISKRHLWVGVKNGEVVASDQGSTNGTYLNMPGTDRISELVLKPGDVLILADDVVRFEYQK